MNSKIQRYYLTVVVPGCECCGPEIVENEGKNYGDWVKYEDHEAEITKLQNLIKGLHNQINILENKNDKC